MDKKKACRGEKRENLKTAENPAFLKEQILTYLGNKRSLLDFIGRGVNAAKSELGRDKISCVDIFSGSGVVARYLKRHASFLAANDLELYSQISNRCYLANANAEFLTDLRREYENLTREISRNLRAGFIAELYAPANDDKILPGERAFYTRKNAVFIDTARELIAKMPADLQPFFIAPLLYEASNRANTSGVFKGFYKNKQGVGQFGGEGKNALKRITSEISLPFPVFSAFEAPFEVYRRDANELARELDGVDLVYLDPPYNQHPYGSNYFMLNLIASYERPSEISAVSGIAKDWNRSAYNQKSRAAEAFFELVSRLKTKFALISYNCEGFISQGEFEKNLSKMGRLEVFTQKYNAFRGSRNLSERNLHVTEFLYVLKKDSNGK